MIFGRAYPIKSAVFIGRQSFGGVTSPLYPTDLSKATPVPLGGPPQSLSLNLNLFTNPIPINNAVLLLSSSRVKSSPPDQVHLNILLPIPFNQLDWGKYQLNPDYPVPVQYPNIAVKVVQNPIVPIDWGRQANIPDFLPFVLYPNLNIRTVGSPLIPLDWGKQQNIPDPLPPPQYPNLVLNTVIVQFPFYTRDFSVPFVPVPAKPDQQALNLNLYKNPIPFAQYDWSKPVTVRANLSDQTYPILVANFSAPFNQTDWSKTRWELISPDQTYPNLLLIQPPAVPFFPVDFQKNATIPSVPSPAMGSNQNLFTNPIPNNQYDWTKLWGVRPIVSDQNNLPNIAVLNPFQPGTPLGLFVWMDWNKAKWPAILIPDQNNLPDLVLIINPITPIVVATPSGRYLKGYEDKLRARLPTPSEQIKKAAAILSSAGGHARAASLTSKQRSNIASTAAKARWK